MTNRSNLILSAIIIVLSLVVASFALTPITDKSGNFSTVLYASDSTLLSSALAPDGQCRFDGNVALPKKYVKSIVLYEDKHFFSHLGIDVLATARAIKVNLKAGRFKQGGSTITMQLARILRNNERRSLWQKFLELILAFKLEFYFTKNEILNLYTTHAPFGSNIVGIKAACYRYFGIPPEKISWAEAALLAVLPNNPALIFPGKNQNKLFLKRNALLKRLLQLGEIDLVTYHLASIEPISQSIKPLPNFAKHLLNNALKNGLANRSVTTTIDSRLQQKAKEVLMRHHFIHKANGVANGAVLILDVQTGQCLAYVGNTDLQLDESGTDVDMITAQRSYGSLLKPFLYAFALEDGKILPRMLLPDIPTNISGYEPQNYFENYEGAVPANEMLSKSLNVPAVRLLNKFGIEKFHAQIKQIGMNSLTKGASHYGLSIILGGAESSLWQISNMYMNLMRKAMRKKAVQTIYTHSQFNLSANENLNRNIDKSLSENACWHTLEAITESHRPASGGEWINMGGTEKIAWKTGTSYGGRDAWAIGCTPKYVVGVWLGNASGEGRAGLTGIGAAAPLMFEVFSALPDENWPTMPDLKASSLKICEQSGHLAGVHCKDVYYQFLPQKSKYAGVCFYHKLLHLDKSRKYLVNNECESVYNMHDSVWFVLPTIQEWFYKQLHSSYVPLPPIKSDCSTLNFMKGELDLIYPRNGVKIYIPKELSGKKSKAVFKAIHRNKGTKIYWHIDEKYLTVTQASHEIGVELTKPGMHTLTLVDEKGKSISCNFQVIER